MIKENLPITFSIAEVAKMTRFPEGEHKLFEWLRKYGYLLKNNEPSQYQISRGWFVYTFKDIHLGNQQRGVPVSRVTIKGLAGLERVFERYFPVCKPCNQMN
ncbi:phage antirepressor KilAC domain-containing protein [Sediminibacterium salmoneum]|uniref:phage antirepressor KilAC domain-containing protein n=1 Tax=Sediminibacterium salmoneum TaxID=426421 RepID=UPI00047D05CE|nr:phage antirepressor KilAC domain-containing protein [Sediminibacterium salmoneum]